MEGFDANTEYSDETLAEIYNPEEVDAQKAKSLAAYEARVVKKILTRFSMLDVLRDMKREVKDSTGGYNANLAWFNDRFPDFPVRLGCARVGYVHQVKVVDLFTKFTKQKFFEKWELLRQEVDEISPVGLVFPWPGLTGQDMIIHDNDGLNERAGCNMLSYMIKANDSAYGAYIRLLPFIEFINIVAQDWPGYV